MSALHSTALMDAFLKIEGKNLNTMAELLHNRANSIDHKMKIYSVYRESISSHTRMWTSTVLFLLD